MVFATSLVVFLFLCFCRYFDEIFTAILLVFHCCGNTSAIVRFSVYRAIVPTLVSVLNPFYSHMAYPISDADKVTLFFTMMTLLSLLHFGLLLLCLFSAVVCLYISTNQLHR